MSAVTTGAWAAMAAEIRSVGQADSLPALPATGEFLRSLAALSRCLRRPDDAASTAALPALLQLLAQLPPAVSSVEAAPAESQAAFAEALGALSKFCAQPGCTAQGVVSAAVGRLLLAAAQDALLARQNGIGSHSGRASRCCLSAVAELPDATPLPLTQGDAQALASCLLAAMPPAKAAAAGAGPQPLCADVIALLLKLLQVPAEAASSSTASGDGVAGDVLRWALRELTPRVDELPGEISVLQLVAAAGSRGGGASADVVGLAALAEGCCRALSSRVASGSTSAAAAQQQQQQAAASLVLHTAEHCVRAASAEAQQASSAGIPSFAAPSPLLPGGSSPHRAAATAMLEASVHLLRGYDQLLPPCATSRPSGVNGSSGGANAVAAAAAAAAPSQQHLALLNWLLLSSASCIEDVSLLATKVSWSLTQPLTTAPVAADGTLSSAAAELCLTAAEAFAHGLAVAWQAGHGGAVKGMLVLPSTCGSGQQQQAVVLAQGRLFVLLHTSGVELSLMLLSMATDAVASSPGGGGGGDAAAALPLPPPPSATVHCAMMAAADMAVAGAASAAAGGTGAGSGRRCYSQVVEALLTLYRRDLAVAYDPAHNGSQAAFDSLDALDAVAAVLQRLAEGLRDAPAPLLLRQDLRAKLLALFTDVGPLVKPPPPPSPKLAPPRYARHSLGALLPAVAAACEGLDASLRRMFAAGSVGGSSGGTDAASWSRVTLESLTTATREEHELLKLLRAAWLFIALHQFSRRGTSCPRPWVSAVGRLAAATPMLLPDTGLGRDSRTGEAVKPELCDRLAPLRLPDAALTALLNDALQGATASPAVTDVPPPKPPKDRERLAALVAIATAEVARSCWSPVECSGGGGDSGMGVGSGEAGGGGSGICPLAVTLAYLHAGTAKKEDAGWLVLAATEAFSAYTRRLEAVKSASDKAAARELLCVSSSTAGGGGGSSFGTSAAAGSSASAGGSFSSRARGPRASASSPLSSPSSPAAAAAAAATGLPHTDASVSGAQADGCVESLAATLICNLHDGSHQHLGPADGRVARLCDALLHTLLVDFPALYWSRTCLGALLAMLEAEEGDQVLGQRPLVGRADKSVESSSPARDSPSNRMWRWLQLWVYEAAVRAPGRTEALLHHFLGKISAKELNVVPRGGAAAASSAALRRASELLSVCSQARQASQLARLQVPSDGVLALCRKQMYCGLVAGQIAAAEAEEALALGGGGGVDGIGSKSSSSSKAVPPRTAEGSAAASAAARGADDDAASSTAPGAPGRQGPVHVVAVRVLAELEEAVACGLPLEALEDRVMSAAALLVMTAQASPGAVARDPALQRLLTLLCDTLLQRFSAQTLNLALSAWTWVSAAAPELLVPCVAAVTRAWMQSVDRGMGLFSGAFPPPLVTTASPNGAESTAAAAAATGGGLAVDDLSSGGGRLARTASSHITDAAGSGEWEHESEAVKNAVLCHHKWLAFFIELWRSVRDRSDDRAHGVSRLLHQMLSHSLFWHERLSNHPGSAGARFRLLQLAISYFDGMATKLQLAAAVGSPAATVRTDSRSVRRGSNGVVVGGGGGKGAAASPAAGKAAAAAMGVAAPAAGSYEDAAPVLPPQLATLHERLVRAGLMWFTAPPSWCFRLTQQQAEEQHIAVSLFAGALDAMAVWLPSPEEQDRWRTEAAAHAASDGGAAAGPPPLPSALEGCMQLLWVLCEAESMRLKVWSKPLVLSDPMARPIGCELTGADLSTLLGIAWAVHPALALHLPARIRSAAGLQPELEALVARHAHQPVVQALPEAALLLAAAVHRGHPATTATAASAANGRGAAVAQLRAALAGSAAPSADAAASPLLSHLATWSPADVVEALHLMSSPEGSLPQVRQYAARCLRNTPAGRLSFYLPQLVQCLRSDANDGIVASFLADTARGHPHFAHRLIWALQTEATPPPEAFSPDVKRSGWTPPCDSGLWGPAGEALRAVLAGLPPEGADYWKAEEDYIGRITDISGILKKHPKEERKSVIVSQLRGISPSRPDLYIPTNPRCAVLRHVPASGTPMQSAKKVPILVAFEVEEGRPEPLPPLGRVQACIFKVGDDVRQDVLALQVIDILRGAFEAAGLDLYLRPYGVLATGYERGVIEVVPHCVSRASLGECSDAGLHDIYTQRFGPPGSPRFEAARSAFVSSQAGYAIASYLLQAKDRHNGNILIDSVGHIVHIDFGFILEISPGGNMKFESAAFKMSHEMCQLLDPGGKRASAPFRRFEEACVRGFLAARSVMDPIMATVSLMKDSKLPCFGRGAPVANLRARFQEQLSEQQAAAFVRGLIADAYSKWTTGAYDYIQALQNKIPY